MTISSVNEPAPFNVHPTRILARPVAEPGGDVNLNKNYAVPVDAIAAAPPGFNWLVSTADFFMQGPGSVFANNYGPISGLTNGVSLEVRNEDDTLAVPAVVIRTTGDFASVPGMSVTSLTAGPGDIYVNVTWSIARAVGSPIALRPGMKLSVTVQDDMSGLTVHLFTAAGYLVPADT